MQLDQLQDRLKPNAASLVPGLLVVALMIVWAVHNGGYDEATWYWGALVILAALTATRFALGAGRRAMSRPEIIVLTAFALYVAWSYASIAWASSPGDALAGSNRALLYLLVFALMLTLPWTEESALIVLLTFVIGVGVVAIVILFRLASDDHIARLIIGGRLAAPTGYFNATAALFTLEALVAIALAARRELPGLLRGLLLAIACAGLQLGVIVQSRGWLFTLPLIAIVSIALLKDRLRIAALSALPIAGAVIPVQRLLHVYQSSTAATLDRASVHAGHAALLICAAVFVAGALVAWGESLRPRPTLTDGRRRAIGTVVALLVLLASVVGGVAATHGKPFRFISRQWHGFSHTQTAYASGSHFADVGSGRYDFWRVSLDAFGAHPLGGLGQDNFADYYVTRRRTGEEPKWTHSLEMRLLVHTGALGLVLFGIFVALAIATALRFGGRQPPGRSGLARVALLPLVVWLIHGSVDWFWEMPALTGPALGFLGMALALRAGSGAAGSRQVISRPIAATAGIVAVLGATAALGFPYLAARELSAARGAQGTDPAKALRDLRTAADLNPLSADPGRLGGAIALATGNFTEAERWFSQARSREPRGWFAWLGDGLAASALGERARAQRDLTVALSINPHQSVILQALHALSSSRPLTPAGALQLLTKG